MARYSWRNVVGIGLMTTIMLLCYALSQTVSANTLPATPYLIQYQNSYQQNKTFLGKTVGERVSDISFERGGLITQLNVNDGQTVTAGEVIATLDTQLLLERQKQLQAQKRGIQAQRTLSVKELKRIKTLRQEGHISAQAFDREHTNLNNLTSRLDAINAQLASVALDIEKSVLKAPFNGTVLQRYVNQGVSVQAGQQVVRLQESTIDEVHIGVAQQYLSQLNIGDCHPIAIDNRTVEGCISHIVRQLSPNTQTVRVIFTLPPNHTTLSGQIAKLSLTEKVNVPGAWIPSQALVHGMRGTWAVYQLLPEKDDPQHALVQMVQVEVITTHENKNYIRSSLPQGTMIIATGVLKYAPGQRVMVQAVSPPKQE